MNVYENLTPEYRMETGSFLGDYRMPEVSCLPGDYGQQSPSLERNHLTTPVDAPTDSSNGDGNIEMHDGKFKSRIPRWVSLEGDKGASKNSPTIDTAPVMTNYETYVSGKSPRASAHDGHMSAAHSFVSAYERKMSGDTSAVVSAVEKEREGTFICVTPPKSRRSSSSTEVGKKQVRSSSRSKSPGMESRKKSETVSIRKSRSSSILSNESHKSNNSKSPNPMRKNAPLSSEQQDDLSICSAPENKPPKPGHTEILTKPGDNSRKREDNFRKYCELKPSPKRLPKNGKSENREEMFQSIRRKFESQVGLLFHLLFSFVHEAKNCQVFFEIHTKVTKNF